MNFFTRAATTALTGLAIFGFASAAFARPITSDHEKHEALVESIVDAGVRLYVNPQACDRDNVMGWYSGMGPVMVVCQENREVVGEQVEWTEEDYDTLRHEAQHLIQDCMVGSNNDHVLSPVYRDPIGNAFGVLGAERMAGINRAYRANGADTETVILEWEAFTVADLNIPLDQAADIQRYCAN